MNVEMGTMATADVAGRWSITLSMECCSDFETRKLNDVLHVPSFEYSLPSVSAADKKGMKTTFGAGECVIHRNSRTIATRRLEGLLYVIQTKMTSQKPGKVLLSSPQVWHKQTGNVDIRLIAQMADREVVKSLNFNDRDFNSKCHHCAVSKGHRSPIPKFFHPRGLKTCWTEYTLTYVVRSKLHP